MLLAGAAAEFLRYCEIERQLSQHTLLAYEGDLDDFCRFVGPAISVDSICMVRPCVASGFCRAGGKRSRINVSGSLLVASDVWGIRSS
jgi:site-specific recombinase XerC